MDRKCSSMLRAVGGIRRQFQVALEVGARGGHVLGLQMDQAALAVFLG